MTGREYLAIPGPSVVPDAVQRAMHRASPNIYDGELIEVTATVVRDLKWVAGTAGHLAIYICNGHGVWEASLTNVCAPGDRVLVLDTGAFAKSWATVAQAVGLRVDVLDFGLSAPVDPNRVREAVQGQDYAAVLMCHVDTSTTVRSDVAAVRAAMDGSDALLMVDCIASLGCDRYEMDAMGADVTIAASQKGLMCPPGVAFVWFNDRAAARGRADVSPHWSWGARANPEMYYQHFHGTAPTHHIYGLRAALDLMKAEGLDAIWSRHARFARAVWAAVDAWGAPMALNVADVDARAHSVTSLTVPGAEPLRAWCAAHTGVTFGIGLGREPAEDWMRIGHMGHLNAHMVLGGLAALEAGLIATGTAHGPGALSAAAAVVAEGGAVGSGSVAAAGCCC